ncbi:Uncharacterised protein [Vibrio cholerae]|nr:Uncharacterised protein [Vibrio cholerae]
MPLVFSLRLKRLPCPPSSSQITRCCTAVAYSLKREISLFSSCAIACSDFACCTDC